MSSGEATLWPPDQLRPSRGQRGSRSSLLPQGRGSARGPLAPAGLVSAGAARSVSCVGLVGEPLPTGTAGVQIVWDSRRSPSGLLLPSLTQPKQDVAPRLPSSRCQPLAAAVSLPHPALVSICSLGPRAGGGAGGRGSGPSMHPGLPLPGLRPGSRTPRAPVPPSSAVLGPFCPSHHPGRNEQAGFAAMAAPG